MNSGRFGKRKVTGEIPDRLVGQRQSEDPGHGGKASHFAPFPAAIIIFLGVQDRRPVLRRGRVGINTKNTFFDPLTPEPGTQFAGQRTTARFKEISRSHGKHIGPERRAHRRDDRNFLLIAGFEDLRLGIQRINGVDHKVRSAREKTVDRFHGRESGHGLDVAARVDQRDPLLGGLGLELSEIRFDREKMAMMLSPIYLSTIPLCFLMISLMGLK